MRRASAFWLSALCLTGLLAAFLRTGQLPISHRAAAAVRETAAAVLPWAPKSEAPAPEYVARPFLPLVVDAVVGPEAAHLPEIRIWAFRNGHRYGWVQLPRGTNVDLVQEEGDYLIVRFEGTLVKVHREVVKSGLVTPIVRGTGRVAQI